MEHIAACEVLVVVHTAVTPSFRDLPHRLKTFGFESLTNLELSFARQFDLICRGVCKKCCQSTVIRILVRAVVISNLVSPLNTAISFGNTGTEQH